MFKNELSRNFSPAKFKQTELNVFCKSIIQAMDGNVHFPNPVPSLEQLQKLQLNYQQSLVDTIDGTRFDTAVKRNCREKLVDGLRALANYVEAESDGNLEVLASSGFNLKYKPRRIGVLPGAKGFNVRPGSNPGVIELSCQVVPKASFYLFAYTESPVSGQSVWITVTSSKRKARIEGLQSGKRYAFRVAACGTRPERVWSPSLESYVL
ncbi:fibronectin type III domain-containing protein [Mangrovibacterium marinum]|nr:fibronectin type III domain-containing protein [Mangrovibacterium marinum]